MEMCEGHSPEECMVTAPKGDDVEAQFFVVVVVGCAEHYIQGYPARALCLNTWYYTF